MNCHLNGPQLFKESVQLSTFAIRKSAAENNINFMTQSGKILAKLIFSLEPFSLIFFSFSQSIVFLATTSLRSINSKSELFTGCS